MPLKIAIIGRAFSGKKLQAQILAEKFNLSIYKPEELINEAMERSEEDFETLKEIVEKVEGDELERQEGVEDEAKLVA